ncbi:hypothetical protein TSOC_004821 [Tetrabaena socialis]|uniref:Uncharacterized protein n=1 Tax=Tetrabaena socialis TaxID=47790 RepID=A0A2J8A7W9_9CHLO|nr:hypothetical protein TSOC_004821 [Tetrabaena socialis]|eukprot:PNH08624.1 hypothetical protein TSOC_004821 [Tetrabaena socialis]
MARGAAARPYGSRLHRCARIRARWGPPQRAPALGRLVGISGVPSLRVEQRAQQRAQDRTQQYTAGRSLRCTLCT